MFVKLASSCQFYTCKSKAVNWAPNSTLYIAKCRITCNLNLRHENIILFVYSQKPIIKGLVVDSASNQQPSIVRASKNANIREEFALKQRVDGYRSACSDNINRINIAQRRMSSHLVNLKNKMASFSGPRAPADDMSVKLFLHNKGYVPKTLEQQLSTYCFPPLMYPKRRLLTVN